MSNEAVLDPETGQPLVSAPEVPEQIYVYQPTDELGRPLGGKQVIKYRTAEELTQKLVEQNTLLIRKLREETKKNRLGIIDVEEIPDGAPRFQTAELTPRHLTAEERVQLSRDLLDPEKFDEARDAFFEAAMGAKPEQLRQTISSQEERIQFLLAKSEAEMWVKGISDYYGCKENWKMLTDWMVKNDLAPVRENFQRAYDVLKAAGLLLEAPIVREEPPSPPVQAPVPSTPSATEVIEPTSANPQPIQDANGRITVEDPAQAKRPVVEIPTGLTRNQAADAGTPRPIGDEIVYEIIIRDGKGKPTGEKKVYRGLAAIDAMSGEEYGRRLKTDPAFGKKVLELEATRGKRQP